MRPTCQCCDPEAAAARDAAEAADPTPPMGLEPSDPACRCRLCEPAPPGSLDAVDARTDRTVLRHGWQVVAVTGGRGPAFASTVGLPHRAGHPELVMSGLDPELMHRCLNRLARRVVDGAEHQAGEVVEGVLAGVPVLLEALRPAALADTVACSRRFHRARVEALQVVWPDPATRFGWQPGADDQTRRGQPSSWRVPAGRTGMLAPDPVWPLSAPPDAFATACWHVVEDGAPVLQVSRSPASAVSLGEDEWTVGCGAHEIMADLDRDLDDDGEPVSEFTTTHLAHLVRAAPSLATLADLPGGGEALRVDPAAPWQRWDAAGTELRRA